MSSNKKKKVSFQPIKDQLIRGSLIKLIYVKLLGVYGQVGVTEPNRTQSGNHQLGQLRHTLN